MWALALGHRWGRPVAGRDGGTAQSGHSPPVPRLTWWCSTKRTLACRGDPGATSALLPLDTRLHSRWDEKPALLPDASHPGSLPQSSLRAEYGGGGRPGPLPLTTVWMERERPLGVGAWKTGWEQVRASGPCDQSAGRQYGAGSTLVLFVSSVFLPRTQIMPLLVAGLCLFSLLLSQSDWDILETGR